MCVQVSERQRFANNKLVLPCHRARKNTRNMIKEAEHDE
jgi:hypothetical protein